MNNNMNKLENEMFKANFANISNIKLHKKQLNILIEKIEELQIEFNKYVEFLDTPKFTNIFYSNEVTSAINQLMEFCVKNTKKKNSYCDFILHKNILEQLKNLRDNRKLIKDLFVSLNNEQNKVISNLRHYTPQMNIFRQLFNLTAHIKYLIPIIGSTQIYYITNKNSIMYSFIYDWTEKLVDTSTAIMDIYMGWEEERGC